MPRFAVVVFALAAVAAAVWIVRGSDPGQDVSRWNDAPATPERHPAHVRIPGGSAHRSAHEEGVAADEAAAGAQAAGASETAPFHDPDALAAALGKGSAPGARPGANAPDQAIQHRMVSGNAPSVASPSGSQPAPEAAAEAPAAPDAPPDLDLEAQVAALAEARHLLTPAQIDQRVQRWLRRNGLTSASASPADFDRARNRVLSDQAIAVELADSRFGEDAPPAQKQPTIDLANTLLPYQTQAWRNAQLKKVVDSSAKSGP